VGFSGKSVPAVDTRSKNGKVIISSRAAATDGVFFIKMEGKIKRIKTDEQKSDGY
jgi:hypothetical protein